MLLSDYIGAQNDVVDIANIRNCSEPLAYFRTI